jgi:hypothetical protein
MNVIRIHKQIDSETLHLPELKPLIGKRVEIIVIDVTDPADANRWAALEGAAQGLTDYDFDAWREQREYDREHGQPPLLP